MKDLFAMVSLETMMEEHIGKMGTPKRDEFEEELRIDLALNKYDDQILFPKKLAKANEILRKQACQSNG